MGTRPIKSNLIVIVLQISDETIVINASKDWNYYIMSAIVLFFRIPLPLPLLSFMCNNIFMLMLEFLFINIILCFQFSPLVKNTYN